MAVEDTDLLLIERGGTQYKAAVSELPSGGGGVSLPATGPIGGLLRLVSLLPFTTEWAEPTGAAYTVWCEENGALGVNAYEWSWGNGAVGNDIGFPVMVAANLTHISFNADTFGTSVQINARRATTPGSGSIIANPVFTGNNTVFELPVPILFNPGDTLVVQTGELVGTTTDARAFFRFQEV